MWDDLSMSSLLQAIPPRIRNEKRSDYRIGVQNSSAVYIANSYFYLEEETINNNNSLSPTQLSGTLSISVMGSDEGPPNPAFIKCIPPMFGVVPTVAIGAPPSITARLAGLAANNR